MNTPWVKRVAIIALGFGIAYVTHTQGMGDMWAALGIALAGSQMAKRAGDVVDK